MRSCIYCASARVWHTHLCDLRECATGCWGCALCFQFCDRFRHVFCVGSDVFGCCRDFDACCWPTFFCVYGTTCASSAWYLTRLGFTSANGCLITCSGRPPPIRRSLPTVAALQSRGVLWFFHDHISSCVIFFQVLICRHEPAHQQLRLMGSQCRTQRALSLWSHPRLVVAVCAGVFWLSY